MNMIETTPFNLLETHIETPRLVLQPVSIEYLDTVFHEFTDDITRYMHPRTPKEKSETKKFIHSTIKKMKKNEELVCVVLHKTTQEFLGIVGLHHISTATPELGVWMKKSAHGQQYGREAVTGIKEWADQQVIYDHLIYPVATDNIASRKIPESLGGKIMKEYTKTNMSGNMLPFVEYWIYR